MNIAALIDDEVMRHLSMFGCIKNADPLVQHILKTSEEPILRFRRDWMRREALKQHLDAERRQKMLNDKVKNEPFKRKANMRKTAEIDIHLAAEMLHYNHTDWQDKKFVGNVRAEAPAIFPKRDSI